ncbi:MAG: DUF4375 domain-containing protein [Flavobacteriales bacterium]|jgi:hypothetical protein|nr:DUF4375 domain-containing protein [Flavobacteriales bacterium]
MKFHRSVFERTTAEDVWDGIQESVWAQVPDDLTIPHPDEMVRTVLLITGLLNQAENGGIIQFIDNWDGCNFHETREAAQRIACTDLVDLLDRVANLYPDRRVPKNWEERRELWDRLCEERYLIVEDRHLTEPEWDDLWYGIDNELSALIPDIKQKTVAYVRSKAELVD